MAPGIIGAVCAGITAVMSVFATIQYVATDIGSLDSKTDESTTQ